MAMEKVAANFAYIAEKGKCSVQLVHHSRKTKEEATHDDARGASAVVAAARTVRVLNVMSSKDAEIAGNIPEGQRRLYFRADVGKANLSAPPEFADWFRLKSVDLENHGGDDWNDSDHVGVVDVYDFPKAPKLKGGDARCDPRARIDPGEGPVAA